MRTLGDNIRERRKALGMTQMELAKKCGLYDASSISKIEKNMNDVRIHLFSFCRGISRLFVKESVKDGIKKEALRRVPDKRRKTEMKKVCSCLLMNRKKASSSCYTSE